MQLNCNTVLNGVFCKTFQEGVTKSVKSAKIENKLKKVNDFVGSFGTSRKQQCM